MDEIITIGTTVATPIFQDIVRNLVKDLFVPKFKKFFNPLFDKTGDLLNKHEEYFCSYLNRMYEKNYIVNAMALANSQVKLKEVYVTQTLVLDRDNYFESDEEEIKVDKVPIELIKRYKKILIKDPIGMGKSTIMKYMFIDLIENHIKELGIPIFIELSQLTDKNTIIKEIHNELNSLSKEFDTDKLYRFIQNGGFIFFFDGYDEIPSRHKTTVTKDINEFISKASNNSVTSNDSDNYFILTSRSEERLNFFGGFQKFRIKPLTKEEAFELISKYDLSKEKKDSTLLINELNTGKYKSIDDCLKNPLLVSLLFYVFRNQKETTLSIHSFCREIYDAFFNGQDLSKGIEPHIITSGLSLDDLSHILRFVGYICLIKEKEDFEKDDFLRFIGWAKNNCRKNDFSESDCLNDLLLAVPFLYKKGGKYYWAYKSLRDYFAAQYIALDANNQDNILISIYQSEHIFHYINMLNIYYYVDNMGFTKNIIQSLCNNFITFFNRNFVDLKITPDIIEKRVGLLFHFAYAKLGVVSKDTYVCQQNNIGILSHYNLSQIKDAYLFTVVNNIHFILKLLYEIKPTLYAEIDNKNTFVDLDDALCNYEINEFHNENSLKDVDVKTGDMKEESYMFINKILIESMKSNPLVLPLDYKACLSEINNIKQRIQKNNMFNLLPT
jgi:hypothetical protein